MKKINIILIVIAGLLLVDCSHKPTYILPIRNLDELGYSSDSINTSQGEISPYIRINTESCSDAYFKESANGYMVSESGVVKPSSQFFKELLGEDFASRNKSVIDYLTAHLESATFLTKNSGFVALSHPPDESYANVMRLPFIGSVGGTDIFYFSMEGERLVFRALPEKINSIFWDSHPWVGQDENCNLVLIWSSDRDNPYSATRLSDAQVIKQGNSDLFYAFKIGNYWTNPAKLSTLDSINTDKYNEISPFVACVNIAPKLLFSSNRNGDYDIYEADIKIDFETRRIEANGKPRLLPKGSQYSYPNSYINTEADEMFPLVAFPYKANSNDKELFFSSNRNAIERQINKDSSLVSKGSFDLYMFNYQLECKVPAPPPPPPPPTALLKFKVIDKTNPSKRVMLPIVRIIEVGSGKEHLERSAEFTYKLEEGKEYDIFAGSEQNSMECNVMCDTLLNYYKTIKITRLEPIIKRKETKVEYDSIVNPTLKIAYDTTLVTEIVPVSQAADIQATNPDSESSEEAAESENIVGVSYVRCPPKDQPPAVKPTQEPSIPKGSVAVEQPIRREPFLEITKQVITKREWYEGGKVVKKQLKLISYDTIPRYDTTMIHAIGTVGKSELTHLGTIKIPKLTEDIVINDVIYLEPKVEGRVDCNVSFIDIKSDYNKNVPYYQTAFWKVNTSAGLREARANFGEGGLLEGAAYIELHPRNRAFWGAMGKREERLRAYENYSREVDKNLQGMSDEVTQHYLPALDAFAMTSPEMKLIVKLEAYSDIRDASKCAYIGRKIEYLEGRIDSVDKKSGKIVINKTTVENQANLGDDNDNLSKLRVYYGFEELFSLLRKSKIFNRYLEQGLVFYPTQKFASQEAMEEAMKSAKIIILAEGRKSDPVVKTDIEDYDPVRRLNMYIHVIKFSGEYVVESPCCKPADFVPAADCY